MNSKRNQKWSGRAMTFVALALCVTGATSARADFSGGVDIVGNLYVDGVQQKVKCSAGEGNTVDANILGTRVFHLKYGSRCLIYQDTSDADTFQFVGNEEHPYINGVTSPSFVFSGVQIAAGPVGSERAEGAVNSLNKCTGGGSCTTEKGKITYSRTNGLNHDVVFIGTWKAHY